MGTTLGILGPGCAGRDTRGNKGVGKETQRDNMPPRPAVGFKQRDIRTARVSWPGSLGVQLTCRSGREVWEEPAGSSARTRPGTEAD